MPHAVFEQILETAAQSLCSPLTNYVKGVRYTEHCWKTRVTHMQLSPIDSYM